MEIEIVQYVPPNGKKTIETVEINKKTYDLIIKYDILLSYEYAKNIDTYVLYARLSSWDEEDEIMDFFKVKEDMIKIGISRIVGFVCDFVVDTQ